MNQTDQIKLLDAGFTIIRRRDNFPLAGDLNKPDHRIAYKNNDCHEWRILEKGFKSKAARDRRMTELLKERFTVED